MLQRKRAGLYVGNEGIRVVEVRGNGRLSIVRAWKGDSRPDLSTPAALKEAVRSALSESGISVGSVSVSIPDTLARAAVLDFEELPKSKKDAQEIIRARAAKELDAEPAESAFSFQTLPSEPRKKVFCAAAKRAVIEALEEGVCSAGRRIAISRISPHSLNIVNLLLVDREDVSVVTRASDYLAILIFKDGVLDFYRCKVTGDDAEVKRELASTFAFYCGKNPEHRISRILLFDQTENHRGTMADSLPARIELPGEVSFLLESPDITGKDISLLAAAGSCV